jgi:TrfA protein
MDSIGGTLQGMKERMEVHKELSRQREEEYYETGAIQLPLWHEEKRGTPNSFLRSALFAAIQSKDRVNMQEVEIFSQQGISIEYTGEQLNQEDLVIWLALVDLMKRDLLGTQCSFTAHSILSHMEMDTGGKSHEQLRRSILRMTACAVAIKFDRRTYTGSIIGDFTIDDDDQRYKVTLNRRLIKLFADNDWTAISSPQSNQLRGKPLALKLHGYYSSHEKPLALTVEFLHKLTGSKNSQLRDFKRRLKTALGELVKIDFLKGYVIEGDMVKVERVPKPYRVIGGGH